jgi:hypothetical protein
MLKVPHAGRGDHYVLIAFHQVLLAIVKCGQADAASHRSVEAVLIHGSAEVLTHSIENNRIADALANQGQQHGMATCAGLLRKSFQRRSIQVVEEAKGAVQFSVFKGKQAIARSGRRLMPRPPDEPEL